MHSLLHAIRPLLKDVKESEQEVVGDGLGQIIMQFMETCVYLHA